MAKKHTVPCVDTSGTTQPNIRIIPNGISVYDLITRLEVIHGENMETIGRVYSSWDVDIVLSFQDDGRTLKLFVTKRDGEETPRSLVELFEKLREENHGDFDGVDPIEYVSKFRGGE